jgi:hypothetical protein
LRRWAAPAAMARKGSPAQSPHDPAAGVTHSLIAASAGERCASAPVGAAPPPDRGCPERVRERDGCGTVSRSNVRAVLLGIGCARGGGGG